MTDTLLLDTHVWLWFMSGDSAKLSPVAISRISEAMTGGRCFVSVMSIWELALLEAKGRLTLAGSLERWVAGSRVAPGVRITELTPEIAIESTRLPGSLHADPADRIIIATARTLGAVLVTRDRAISQYGAGGYIRVLDPAP